MPEAVRRLRIPSWLVDVMVLGGLCLVYVRAWPAGVPLAVAVVGGVLTHWWLGRVTEDRVCVRLGVAAYWLKVGLAAFLYYASAHAWPILQEYQGGEGFWVFAEDTLAHYGSARRIANCWQGLEQFPFIGYSNWSFEVYLAGIFRLLGAHTLTGALFNAWHGTAMVAAVIGIVRRWTPSPAAHRRAVALIALWPSLLLWSSQLVKEPLVLMLILTGLYLLVRLLHERRGRTRSLVRLSALFGLVVIVVSIFRLYVGALLGVTAVAAGLASAVGLVRRRALRPAANTVVWVAIVAAATLTARFVDIKPWVVPPGVSLAAGMLDPRVPRPLPPPERAPASAEPPSAPTPSVGASPSPGPSPSPTASAVAPAVAPDQPPPPAPLIVAWWQRLWGRMVHVAHHLQGGAAMYLNFTAVDRMRGSFVRTAGYSTFDPEVKLDHPLKALQYLPRSLAVGLLAPFPTQWFDTSGRTRIFRSLAAVEVLLVYLLLVGVVLRARQLWAFRSLSLAAVVGYAVLVAGPLCLLVANLGTLFRLRLQFLLPLMLVISLTDVAGGYRDAVAWAAQRLHRLRQRLTPAASLGFARCVTIQNVMRKSRQREHGSERAFGLTVGTVCGLLAAHGFWRHAPSAWPLAVAAAGLISLALARPTLLCGPSALWGRLSHALGWFNSRVLLSLFFFAVLTPVGIVSRAFGWDPLRLRRRQGSGWRPYPARESRHYERMY